MFLPFNVLAEVTCTSLGEILTFVKGIIGLIQIIIPIILIVMGMLDLGKAVMAGKEDDIKKAQGMLMKRVIAGVAVFFVGLLIGVIMGMVPGYKNCLNSTGGSTKTEDTMPETPHGLPALN